jgi:hypothetical protein
MAEMLACEHIRMKETEGIIMEMMSSCSTLVTWLLETKNHAKGETHIHIPDTWIGLTNQATLLPLS